MKLLADLSLRWKIPLRVMGAVLGTTFAVTAALLVKDYEDLRHNLEAHAQSLGRVLASTLVTPVLHDDLWRAFEILQSARAAHPVAAELEAQIMLVLDSEKRVFVSSRPRDFQIGSSLHDKGLGFDNLNLSIGGSESAEQQILEPAGSTYYFVVSPLVADGELLGHVVLGYAKTAFLPRYLERVGHAALVTFLVLAMLLPISWFWARRTGQPLLQLAAAMRHVPGELETVRLTELPQNRDEIGLLAQAFQRMVIDLKHKQELESQMLASERLAAVGRLSAGIAHEINNPLGGMLTAIKTFQRHGSGDDLASQTLTLLERGLMQIRNTVAALLVETKIQDRSFEPADVEDVLILVEAEAQARAVRVELADALPGELPLPATLLRQILLNLLLNAIAASAEDGQVRLAIRAAEGMLRITVSNDGEHIPEEQMAYLFEPFATGRKQGHGLGLWVVYQIVRQLNGGLTVDSEPGCTSFHIEIPYVQVD